MLFDKNEIHQFLSLHRSEVIQAHSFRAAAQIILRSLRISPSEDNLNEVEGILHPLSCSCLNNSSKETGYNVK